MWTSPSLQVRWGPYFRPDVTEQKTLVDMVRAALSGEGGAIITRRHAVQKIASIFDIDNVDAVLDEIEKEDEKRRQQSQEDNVAQMSALHDATAGDNRPGAGSGDAEAPVGVGGGGDSASAAQKG